MKNKSAIEKIGPYLVAAFFTVGTACLIAGMLAFTIASIRALMLQ